jgi:thioredoxin reductase (NADPH)
MALNKIYDMVVIGGGPAGYTSALYAARAGLSVLVLEKLSAGGQMALTHQIDNYPGFESGIDGFTLADKMKNQAERFGAESKFAEVKELNLLATPKEIKTAKDTYFAKTVVVAMGANPRELGVDNETALVGRGVSYCAACDGMFYRGKTVAVVGGGDTAAVDALLLSRVAKKVVIIHRRDSLRATKIYHEPLFNAENIEFKWDSVVTEILFDDKVKGLKLKNLKNDEISEVAVDGVFVSVGRIPATDLLKGQIELDNGGYVIAGEDTKTNIEGVFAVGDIRTKDLRQVVTAVADGAVAVHSAEEYLAKI